MGNCGSKKGFRLAPAQNSNPLSSLQPNPVVFAINKAQNYVPEENLIVFDGCCCINHYLYTDLPACLGCGVTLEALCLDVSCCLRPNTRRLACLCCEARCHGVDALCRGQSQACCCVQGFSLPPGRGEPVMLAKFFVVCYPTVGICMNQSNAMLRF
ncbi:hypothetical protein KFE25_010834 [Diacronema lutheri]|uniref:Uncharacterized protein n=1 Tax=Diacronema lutheri TaxID=2081491 RepID=A0A8J6C552_DIALT|nr:hypothetical protein KFE25_010834 [Diacronema lutheri]